MALKRPKVQKARAALIRKLSRMEVDGKVLTVLVDLDPTQFATPGARESEVKSLMNEAEARIEEQDDETKKGLREDAHLVREFLLSDDEWTSEARSVAIFASIANDLFTVIKLPEPLPPGVFIEDDPYLLPVREIVEQDSWCVALVDRRTARIFIGSPVSLRDYDELDDDVAGQHDQGGWSQARYERSVEEEVEDHLKNVADQLLKLHKSMDFDHVVIGTHDELRPRVLERLHPYIAERVAAQIEVDIQMADAAELEEKLKEVQAVREREREDRLLQDLQRGLANDSRAASGISDVLDSLNQARVETLLVGDGWDRSGAVCPKCGYLSLSVGKCPVDGEAMAEVDSLVEELVERADETSAEAVMIADGSALDDREPVAALLRY